MFCDYHVHTAYSDDSSYPMEQVITDAVGMGMDEICITDHVDYGVKIDTDELKQRNDWKGELNVDYESYFEEIVKLQQRFGEKIAIRQGMEFGVQKHTIVKYEKLFSKYAFDFIILSCHQVDDQEFWTQDFQRGRTQQEYNERYYEAIHEVMKSYKNYSVLGHLDLIRRYDPAGQYSFARVSDQVREILKTAVYDGKGIEVNTSSIRYRLDGWMPSWNILNMYRELGGEIITVGSDCHEKSHLGAHIKRAMEELKEAGFRYVCTYEKMKPVFHKL